MPTSIPAFLYSQFFVNIPVPNISFANQTVIITGSNTGLGKTAAEQVAGLNPSKLILAVRNLTAGAEAKKWIESRHPNLPRDVVEVWELDLASFASVKAFAERVQKNLPRLDAISLNAGISVDTYSAAEGYERTITVNVLSTFLLALLVLPKLKETHERFNVNPRLSITASEVHNWVSFPERNTPSEQKVIEVMSRPDTKTMGDRYMASKLMEVLLFQRLRPQINVDTTGVVFTIVNPGFCHSDIMRDMNGWIVTIFKAVLARSQDVGGRPITWSISEGAEKDGKYMHDSRVNDGYLSNYVTSQEGAEMGERLWKECVEVFEKNVPGVTNGL